MTTSATFRHKLGLALAGGGFRASLFHLGVLRRMAELDLLRYVEVLSTVSGGSIVGALYAMLLKQRLDRALDGRLSRDDYVTLVEELHRRMARGIRKNLRTRLFLNPLGMLLVLLTPRSLGKRMARLYERYLYEGVLPEQERPGWWARLTRPGRVPLAAIHITPGGRPITGGLEAYNRRIVSAASSRPAGAEPGSVVTKLVLNATSLNSGARFWFSAVELGDWFLGHIRADEIDELLERKMLLEPPVTAEDLGRALGGAAQQVVLRGHGGGHARRAVSLALWWRRSHERERVRAADAERALPEGWEPLFQITGFPGRIPRAPLGRLRLAKLAAWYLRVGAGHGISGGVDQHLHWRHLWDELGRMDESLAGDLRAGVERDPALGDLLLDFVIELYYLRTAAVVSWRFRRDWRRLSVGDAVGASACFPPVFPPYQELGFYDDAHVSRLGLTDGGVYDNVGLRGLLDEGCTHIIASDTGGMFETMEHASTGRLGMMRRIVGILMADIGWWQRDLVYERRRASAQMTRHLEREGDTDRELRTFRDRWGLRSLAFFHISSPPIPLAAAHEQPAPLDPPIEGPALARLRTDLDGFGDVEIAALVNHGYVMADRYLRRRLHATPYRDERYWSIAPRLPCTPAADVRARRIVRVGRARVGRSLQLRSGWSLISWAAVAIAAAALASAVGRWWAAPVSVAGALRALATRSAGWLEAAVPVPVARWTERFLPLGPAVLAIVAVIAAVLFVRRVVRFRLTDWLRERGLLRAARRVAAIAKWVRGGSGNLLWLLGGAPLWIAAGSALFAGVSYLVFHLPFMAATRQSPADRRP